MKHIVSWSSMVAIVIVSAGVGIMLPALASASVVYNAVPNPLPPNAPSQPFQAQQTFEFGDYVHLGGTDRVLTTVTVAMSDWALYSTYSSDARYSANSSTWSHPITINVYSNHLNASGTPDILLATKTQDIDIPWRPAGDPTCPDTGYGAGFAWRAGDGSCNNGLAFNATFDLSDLNVTLPNDVIVSVAFNTETYGAAPIGVDGPYDSLNVLVPPNDPVTVGSDDNVDDVFWNTITASDYADGGAAGVGIFREDTNWTPYGTVALQIDAVSPAPTSVQVHLFKYLDGVQATTSTANNVSFPMLTTYSDPDVGSGTNVPFTLNPNGWTTGDIAYEASTGPRVPGSSASFSEDTSGTIVGATCAAGDPYTLAGYTTGSSLAAAASGTISLTAPNFPDLSTDEYVIIWNKYCLSAPTFASPANGTVTSTANLTSVSWSAVTDAASGITYEYQASNASTTNPDGSFTSPVYTSSPLTTNSIPTLGTPEGVYFLQVQATDADGNVSPWSTTWMVTVDNTPPPTFLKVHILKYLDGVMATAGNVSGTYQFPMSATWATANLNGGATTTGAYVLGNDWGGAADLYGADTSAMQAPANYATNEVTNDIDGSSKVLPIGADCVAGDYQLTGYQTSAVSFADAASQSLTPNAPNFTGLTSDEYVIVSNITCPTTGSLTVEKDAIGGNGTFTFTGTNGLGAFTIVTASGTGNQTFSNLIPGNYTITETNIPKGWTQTDSDCTSVTVTAGGVDTCTITDTSNKLLGEIRGTKYIDEDGDGTLNDGDHERLAGVTIYLDLNNNGALDAGEPSAVTNKFGEYRFSNLPAGTYHVREVEQTGWIETYPASGSYTIVLGAGKISKNDNFGDFKLGTISGMKFNDLNGNGRMDKGEPGLSGWHINLTKLGSSAIIATTVTDVNGKYSFTNLQPGTYQVREVQQAGWVETTQNPPNVKVWSGTVSKNDDFGNHFGPVTKYKYYFLGWGHY